ncbi:ethionine resistance protein [Kalmusia sp. IMI 367209]|nr:ethionine resistance protein [Kalmusia sp. IMI 367209]
MDLPPSETSPLLPKPHPDDVGIPEWRRWLSETWLLTKASVPVILAYILQNSLQTTSVLIVGRLSSESLATAAFSYMFAMATGWLVALGGTTALDTLASSSYTGSKNKHDLGILLQRGLFVLSLLYAIIALVWIFSEPLFRALGQEEYICVQSARFLQLLIPGGLGYVWFEAMKVHAGTGPGTYVLLITSPLNALLNYLFIYVFGFGLYGAPIATGIAYWASFLLLVAYAAFVRGKECWGRLALLGFIHVGTEWWAFEIVALTAGRLGTVSLAAQSAIMTADQVMNTIPFGLGVAASSRVGNLLGARNPLGARRASYCAAALSVVAGTLVLVVLMGTKNVFGRIFGDDDDVIDLVSKVMPFVALFQIADGLNGSCGGALRGMGKQWVGAVVNIIAYYCAGLPAGIYLAFHGWGLTGLWIGNCAGLYIVGTLELVVIMLSRWDKEVERALGRLAVED